MKDFDDEEKFYIGQMSKERVGYVSDIVDVNYENVELETKKKQHENDILVEEEMVFIQEGKAMVSTDDGFDPDFVMSECDVPIATSSFIHPDKVNMSQNRSGLKRRFSVNESSSQVQNPRPKIRMVRDCTDDIKSTGAQVSVHCGVSAKMAILAVKTVRKSLYMNFTSPRMKQCHLMKRSSKQHQWRLVTKNKKHLLIVRTMLCTNMSYRQQKPLQITNSYLPFRKRRMQLPRTICLMELNAHCITIQLNDVKLMVSGQLLYLKR